MIADINFDLAGIGQVLLGIAAIMAIVVQRRKLNNVSSTVDAVNHAVNSRGEGVSTLADDVSAMKDDIAQMKKVLKELQERR